jgi:hypothetical protein
MLKATRSDILGSTQAAYGHEGLWAERGDFDGVGQVTINNLDEPPNRNVASVSILSAHSA